MFLFIGKIEIIFAKVVPELWVNFGIYDRKRITDYVMYAFEYQILSKVPINHDSYAIALRPLKKLVQMVPLGFHFSLSAKIIGTLSLNNSRLFYLIMKFFFCR